MSITCVLLLIAVFQLLPADKSAANSTLPGVAQLFLLQTLVLQSENLQNNCAFTSPYELNTMEGSGEGIVAIFQDLDNNGLVVAVPNRKRDQTNRSTSKAKINEIKPSGFKSSSVVTSKDHAGEAKISNPLEQSDDHYASSYQVVHCQITPSFPPFDLTEFPPQRSKGNTNQGNFEIGCGRYSLKEPYTRVNSLPKEPRYPIRTVVRYGGTSRCNDAFVESLRKYPRLSSEKSVSSELLEKLLQKTQAKYSQNANRTKSLRSLREKTLKQNSNNINSKVWRIDKRRIHKSERKLIDRRDTTESRRDDNKGARPISAKKDSKNPPPSNYKEVSRKESFLSTTYNYLKTASPPYPELSERQPHLDKYDRQVQRTFQLLGRQHAVLFQVCPELRRRYSEHKKSCPVKSQTASSQPAATESCYCTKASQYSGDLDSDERRQSNKDIVCQCSPNTIDESTQLSTNCIWKLDSLKYICQCKITTDTEYYVNRIDEVISEWLTEIPIRVNETLEDKIRRKNVANELLDTLKELVGHCYADDKVREAIEKAVADMPVWYPGTDEDLERLKCQLVEKLFDTITYVPTYLDKLKVAIKKLIDYVKSEDNLNKKEIVDIVVNKIKYLTNNVPEYDDELLTIFVTEISMVLEELSRKFYCDKLCVLDTFAEKVANNVLSLLENTHIHSTEESLLNTFKTCLSEWLDEIAEFTGDFLDNYEKDGIVNVLALKLCEFLSEYSEETMRIKMINEVNNFLKRFTVPEVTIEELVEQLMDNLTDEIYAKHRRKLNIIYKLKASKVINNWLKNVFKGIELSTYEKRNLIEEILWNIEKATDEGNKDYEDLIFHALTKPSIHSKFGLLHWQIDELVINLKTLPATIIIDNLKEDIRKDFAHSLDELEICKCKNELLKGCLFNIIDKNIKASSLNRVRDLKHLKELLIEEMNHIIIKACTPIDIRNNIIEKLRDILNINFEKILSEDINAVKYRLLKEINFVIGKETITEYDRNYLKYKFKIMINDYFRTPYTDFVENDINENIDDIISDTAIDLEFKYQLINKLTHVVHDNLNELNSESILEYSQRMILNDINDEVDKASISAGEKEALKHYLDIMIKKQLNQRFTKNTVDIIVDNINQIIEDSVESKFVQENLKTCLINIINEKLKRISDQSIVDYVNKTVIKDIRRIIDEFSLPNNQAKVLCTNLGFVLTESSDQPSIITDKDTLRSTIINTIEKSKLSADQKTELTNMLLDVLNKNVHLLPQQTSKDYAKDIMLTVIMRTINKLSLEESTLDNLKDTFENIILKSFDQKHLADIHALLQEGINNVIHQMTIPRNEQDNLINDMNIIFCNILNECFFDDNLSMYLRNNVIDNAEIVIKESLINNFMQEIEEIQLPHNKKSITKNALKEILMKSLGKSTQPRRILQELITVVDEISLTWTEKKNLRTNLASILLTDLYSLQRRLRNVLFKNINDAIDKASLNERIESLLKEKINNFMIYLGDFICTKSKKKIKTGLNNIIDKIVVVREKRINLKNDVSNLVDTLPCDEQDRNIAKEEIIFRGNVIIDGSLIHHLIKKLLKKQFQRVVDEHFDKTFSGYSYLMLQYAVSKIINNAPITNYQHDDLKMKLLDILNKRIENSLRLYTDRIIDDEPFSNAKKSELKNKLLEIFEVILDDPLSTKLKNKIKEAVSKIVADPMIPIDKQSNLKFKLENAITEICEVASRHSQSYIDFISYRGTDQMAKYLEELVNKEIFEIITNMDISEPQEKIIRKSLAHIVSETLNQIQLQIQEDVIKNRFTQDLNQIVRETELSNEMRNDLQLKLFKKADIILNKSKDPVNLDDIHEIIAQYPISLNKQKELVDKIRNAINKILQSSRPTLSFIPNKSISLASAPAINIKERVMSVIQPMLDKLEMAATEKNDLKSEINDIIHNNINLPRISDIIKVMKRNIKNVIHGVPIKGQKEEIIKKISNIMECSIKAYISKLENMPINNDLEIVDIPKYLDASHTKTVQQLFKKIDSIFEQLHIPSHKSNALKLKIGDVLQKNLKQPTPGNINILIKESISKVINEAQVTANQKSDMKNKIFEMLDATLNDLSTDSLKEVFQDKYSTLDQPEAPDNTKRILKLKLQNAIRSNLERLKLVSTHQRAKQGINEVITKTPISKLQIISTTNNKIDSTVNKNSNNTLLDRQKHQFLYETKIMENLQAWLNEIEISRDQKDYIKNKIEYTVKKLQAPINNDTRQFIISYIKAIITEMSISSEIKNEIITKLSNMVNGIEQTELVVLLNGSDNQKDYNNWSRTSIFQPMDYLKPPSAAKVKQVLKEVDSLLDHSNISSNQKTYLKTQIHHIIEEHLGKPICGTTNLKIKESIDNVIDTISIPQKNKSDLKNKLFKLIPTSRYPAKTFLLLSIKDILIKEADEILGRYRIPLIDKAFLIKKLKDKIDNDLDKPLVIDVIQSLNNEIHQIITDPSISELCQKELKNALTNIIGEKMHSLLVTENYPDIAVIRHVVLESIDSTLNEVQLSKDDKNNMMYNIKEVFSKYVHNPISVEALQLMKDEINDVINMTPLDKPRKKEIINKLSDVINDKIAIIPVDENGKKSTSQMQKNTSLQAHSSIYDQIEISKRDKNILKDIIKEKITKFSQKTQSVKPLPAIADIDNMIAKTPTSTNKGLEIESQIHDTMDKNAELLYDEGSSISNKSKSESRVAAMSFNRHALTKPNPTYLPLPRRDSIHGATLVEENEANDYIFTTLPAPKPKEFKSAPTEKRNLTTAILRDMNSIISILNLPINKKAELISDLINIIDVQVDKILSDPNESTIAAKKAIEKNISERLNKMSVPGSTTKRFKRKLMEAVNKNLGGDMDPKTGKPLTSISKMSRKTWEQGSDNLSIMPNNDFIEFDTSEDSDYWKNIINTLVKWMASLPIIIDKQTKENVRKELLGDIDDRRTYLQLYPEAKKTLQEELENLQFQIFRRFHKFLDDRDMNVITEAADVLMRSLQTLASPDPIQDDQQIAHHEYQQRLSDSTPKILSAQEDFSADEQAAFELMKIDLAEAFMSLHYSGGNEEQKKKFKKKLDNAINKFCDEYLKNSPELPLDVENLNQNLYAELKKVTVPTEDSLQSIVEQVLFKKVIKDWLKELTAMEPLDTSKKADALGNILDKIERNNAKLNKEEVKQKMKKEVIKFIKELPLKLGFDKNRDGHATKLINKLKPVSNSKVNTSTLQSNPIDEESINKSQLNDKLKTKSATRLEDGPFVFTPCTLNPEDVEHLKRIRQRTCMAPDCLSSILKNNNQNDYVIPVMIEVGNQTEVNYEYPGRPNICHGVQRPVNPCHVPVTTTTPKSRRVTIPYAQAGNQTEVPPQVIIKKYYCNSATTPKEVESHLPRQGPQFNKRRRLIYETPNLCPSAKPLINQHANKTLTGTCQDMLSGPSSEISIPSPTKLLNSTDQTPLHHHQCHQSFMPLEQSTPRKPENTSTKNCKNGETRGDNLQSEYSESSSNRYPRTNIAIDLGPLDELEKPNHHNRREGVDSSTNSPEEKTQSPCIRHVIKSDRPLFIEEGINCSCKERHKMNLLQKHFRPRFHEDCAMGAFRNNNSRRQQSNRCRQCPRCPYPSYLYFRQ